MSIKGKLIFVTSVFTIIIILLMGMNYFAMGTLSIVRAYTAGEGFWSKGQKDAVYYLARYAVSHNEEDYRQYLINIKIPLGDKIARLELQKKSIDFDKVMVGFIQGKNHPDDIQNAKHVYEKFYWSSGLSEAIDIWKKADVEIENLQIVANELHNLILKNKISSVDTHTYLSQIDSINKGMTTLEDHYSNTLGQLARWVTSVLFWVTFSMASIFLSLGLFVAITVFKNIFKSIEALKIGTILVEQGSLTTPIETYSPLNSKDELNQLANSFNKMTESLSKTISERDNALEKLEIRARQLSKAQELAHMGSWEWDIQNNYLSSSDEIYRILGLVPQQKNITFEYFIERIHFRDREEINTIFKNSLTIKKPFSVDCKIELENGDIREINLQGRVILNEFGEALKVIGYTQDITERFKIQSRMIQSNKMASLGEMAGGIAHEINNPLTIIKLAATQLKKKSYCKSPDLATTKQAILKIDHTVDRISKIVQGLRTFSRDGRNDPFEVVPVASLVDNTLSFCSERFRHHCVKLIRDEIAEELVFEGRHVEISQVLLNLLNNASDAIESLDNKWIQISVKTQGNYLEMRIIDSGKGIPLDIQEKMFQPFFTSKETGRGTGFGLSLSQTIVKGHKGELLFDQEHANTCFVLKLPIKQTHTN